MLNMHRVHIDINNNYQLDDRFYSFNAQTTYVARNCRTTRALPKHVPSICHRKRIFTAKNNLWPPKAFNLFKFHQIWTECECAHSCCHLSFAAQMSRGWVFSSLLLQLLLQQPNKKWTRKCANEANERKKKLNVKCFWCGDDVVVNERKRRKNEHVTSSSCCLLCHEIGRTRSTLHLSPSPSLKWFHSAFLQFRDAKEWQQQKKVEK